MHYYIDGYNLLFRSLHAGGNLEVERRELIEEIEAHASQQGLHITFIFDAASQIGRGAITHYRDVEIVYTDEGESADDRLISRLKHERYPQQCTLVTSDKRLAWRAKCLGAKTQSVEAWVDWLHSRPSKREKKKRMKELPNLPPPPQAPRPSFEEHEYYLEVFEQRLKELEDQKKKKKR